MVTPNHLEENPQMVSVGNPRVSPNIDLKPTSSVTSNYWTISVKSKFHLPSTSTSFIISCNSSSVGFCPRLRMTVPNSLVVIVPSPSLSNKANASRNSVNKTQFDVRERKLWILYVVCNVIYSI